VEYSAQARYASKRVSFKNTKEESRYALKKEWRIGVTSPSKSFILSGRRCYR
jgi:hypothetical protein